MNKKSNIGTVIVRNKKYKVFIARTEEQKERGLSVMEELPEDEGMLFPYDPPEDVGFWMHNTTIPLDIIFINDDLEVTKVAKGKPMDETLIEENDVAYVLELNQNSGVKVGDEVDIDEGDQSDKIKMKVLAPDGSTQMGLQGGERIVSRRETKILLKKALKSNLSQADKDFKALGKYIFKVLDKQDDREPEYVNAPE